MSEHPTSTEPVAAVDSIPPLKLVSQFTDGGHEIDQPPSQTLMIFIAFLTICIIGSTIMVYQLFVSSTNDVVADAASRTHPMLVKQDERDADFMGSYGRVMLEEKPVAYRMPIKDAAAWVMKKPEMMKAAAPPAGWIHPDDVKKAAPTK